VITRVMSACNASTCGSNTTRGFASVGSGGVFDDQASVFM